jgi:hypothetical protein
MAPHRPERPWATAAQVNQIAARATAPNQALIITAAYTGMRWGELAGLRRPNCKLDDGRILIDPDEGALHEVGGRLTLGPPKPRQPYATSSCHRSSSTCSAPTSTATTTTTSSPDATAAYTAAAVHSSG